MSVPWRTSTRRIVIGVSALLVVVSPVTIPAFYKSRELSRRLLCQSNMKGIAMSLKVYAYPGPGTSAEALQSLVERGIIAREQLVCPSSGQSNYMVADRVLQLWRLADNAGPVLVEPKSNHGSEGGNVVFGDGHATFERGADYDRITARAQGKLTP